MTAEEIARLKGLCHTADDGLDLALEVPALCDEVERLRGVTAQLLDVLREAFTDIEDAVALERDIDRGLEIARAALGVSE